MFLVRQRTPVGQGTAGTVALCCMVEPSCGREPLVKGQIQAVEWDTRRMKAAKRPLCLILACSTYAWESHLCLSPVATQIVGLWGRWDFIAYMVEMWVLLQNCQSDDGQRASQPTVLSARPPLTPDQEHESFLGKIAAVCQCRLVPHCRFWRQRRITYEKLYCLG